MVCSLLNFPISFGEQRKELWYWQQRGEVAERDIGTQKQLPVRKNSVKAELILPNRWGSGHPTSNSKETLQKENTGRSNDIDTVANSEWNEASSFIV